MTSVFLLNDFRTCGGAETVFRSLADGLSDDSDIELTVHVGSEDCASHQHSLTGYLHSFRRKREIRKLLENNQPQVIHLFNWNHVLSLSVLGEIVRYRRTHPECRVVLAIHDGHVFCPNSALYETSEDGTVSRLPLEVLEGRASLFRRWDHRGPVHSILKAILWNGAFYRMQFLDSVDVMTVPSEFLKGALEKNFPDTPTILIRNPVAENPLEGDANATGLKSDEIEWSGALRLVFLGRLSREKGLMELLGSLNDVVSPRLELDIYGSGPLKDDLDSFARRISLKGTHKVELKGVIPHEDVMSTLGGYDALLLPSLCYENAPLVVVEGALAGLRIITPAYGGGRELEELCGGGFSYDPQTEGALGIVLSELEKEMAANESLERDYEKLRRVFSRDAFLDAHKNCYSEIFNGR